jgi:hypothetical protein
LFRRPGGDETILSIAKPFFAWRAELSKQAMVINPPTKTGGDRTGHERDCKMSTASLILAFAFLISWSAMAGSAQGDLPGVGTFAYTGSPIAANSPQIVASR